MLWRTFDTCTMWLWPTCVRCTPWMKRVWCDLGFTHVRLCEWGDTCKKSVTEGWHEFRVPLSVDKCARCCLGLTRVRGHLGLTRGLCHLGLSELKFLVIWQRKRRSSQYASKRIHVGLCESNGACSIISHAEIYITNVACFSALLEHKTHSMQIKSLSN